MSYTVVPVVPFPYPPEAIERSRTLLQSMRAIFAEDDRAVTLAQHVLRHFPVHAEQIQREAEAIKSDILEVTIGNICYDLLIGSMGCSTLALPGGSGPVLARNMDWFPADLIARASCLIDIGSAVSAGFAGMAGIVTGMSKRGFAVAVNAVSGGFDPLGYPVLLFLRHVMDMAGDFQSAVELIAQTPLMAGALITVVGSSNHERVVIERTTASSAMRWPAEEQPLCTTNHYRALRTPEFCGRYARLSEYAGCVAPLPLLNHPAVLQDITSQHVLFEPGTQKAEMYVPTRLLEVDASGTSREEAMRILFGN